ncbi:hypothetical protein [Glutamicibacter arilaitensis]|uniref:hypothetical protein n=1 Tax=Glutamicibacter arilaitensis TaxID=256701 RepID=UPI003FD38B85
MVSAPGLPVPMLFETSKEEFFEAFLGAVAELIGEARPFSNDDVRKRLSSEPRHSNWYGAAMGRAVAEFSLIEVGYNKSRTRSRNGGRLILWAPKKERTES